MSTDQLAEFKAALAPIIDVVKTLSPDDKEARAKLQAALPVSGLDEVRKLLRRGVEEGWVCDREAGGVKFSRVHKAAGDELSIDAVHMSGGGPGHTHPNGEFDLCFAVSGDARFDDNPEGWTVYGSGTWHEPTVTGGVMDILYFLPGGAIRFEPKPA